MKKILVLTISILLALVPVVTGCSYFNGLSLPAKTTTVVTTPSTTVLLSSPAPGTPVTSSAPTPDKLVQYLLDLINQDRADYNLPPVVLGTNDAARQHAADMLANYYLSHWDTGGLKPYMRYTVAGGSNYERENSAYAGWYDRTENPDRYQPLDVLGEIQQLEYKMMYDDATSDWGHRDTILYKWNKKVSLGIAYDNHRLALVEQFEGDYVEFTVLPQVSNGILSMNGRVTLGSIDSVVIYFDPLPQPQSQAELLASPRSYGLGDEVGSIVSPPPPGYFYSSLPPNTVQAGVWEVDGQGNFSIQADVSPIIGQTTGVYTVVIWVNAGGESVNLTNYSIFVR